MSFKDDIKGQNTQLYPVVEIDGIWYSTNNVTVNGNYCKPILMNIPSIKESVDVESRKFKISRVSLQFNNFPFEGVRFSDQLSETSLINKEATIYFKSQSDLREVYKGIIRRLSHDDEKISIELEDLTEQKAHKDLPQAYLGDDNSIPDKYKNKPIPMVYGHVDRSPLVIKEINDSSEVILSPDFKDINSINDSGDRTLYIGSSDGYVRIKKNSEKFSNIGFLDVEQYISDGFSEIIIPQISGDDSLLDNPLAYDMAEVEFISLPNKIKLFKEEDSFTSPITHSGFDALDFGDTVQVSMGKDEDGFMDFNWYKISYSLKDLPINNGRYDIHSELNWDVEFNYNANNPTNQLGLGWDMYLLAMITKKIGDYDTGGASDYVSNLFTDSQYDTTVDSGGANNFNFGVFLNNGYKIAYNISALDLGFNESLSLSYSIALWQDTFFSQFDNGQNIMAECTLDVNAFYTKNTYPVTKISSKDFYANVNGRVNTFVDHPDSSLMPSYVDTGGFFPTAEYELIENPIDIIYDLVRSEIGHDNIDEAEYAEAKAAHDGWQFAFTVNKKVSSKKLIEEIAKSTKCFPKFKNDGSFGFNTVKDSYTYEEDGSDYAGATPIKESEVISYSFKKNKPEQIYKKVTVSYNKDYAQDSYLKTAFSEDLGADPYYGIEDSADAHLEFESDYIRDEETADLLASFLSEQYKNDHLIFNLKLPLQYIDLEIGDLVKFESLFQGVKAYGIDYRVCEPVNGQYRYPLFMVTSTTKNLDSVSIECMQLHHLDAVAPVEWNDLSDLFPDADTDIIIHPDEPVDEDIDSMFVIPNLIENNNGQLENTFELDWSSGGTSYIKFLFDWDGETDSYEWRYDWTTNPDLVNLFTTINDEGYTRRIRIYNESANSHYNGELVYWAIYEIISFPNPTINPNNPDTDFSVGLNFITSSSSFNGDNPIAYGDLTNNHNLVIEEVSFESTLLFGDANLDGTLNVLDIVGLVNAILGIDSIEGGYNADVNQDGNLNILDIVGMTNCILGTGSCDFN